MLSLTCSALYMSTEVCNVGRALCRKLPLVLLLRLVFVSVSLSGDVVWLRNILPYSFRLLLIQNTTKEHRNISVMLFCNCCKLWNSMKIHLKSFFFFLKYLSKSQQLKIHFSKINEIYIITRSKILNKDLDFKKYIYLKMGMFYWTNLMALLVFYP